MKFKGFDNWIEIFRGGKQADSRGREHDGDALIDKAIDNFDAKTHEPPLVVGHPKDNAPAFGWIAGLKKIGNVLHAKVKDVVPEFKKAVEQGLYRKRSASFYPDGRLRHVGFLGAAPPAVRSLANLKFEDGDTTFNDLAFDKEPKIFIEAELEAARKQGAEQGRREAELSFAQKERKRLRDQRDEEIVAFVERKVSDGILPPAIVHAGLIEFMKSCDDNLEFEFAEGRKTNPLEFIKSLLDQLGKFNIFTEIATKSRAYERDGPEADEQKGKDIAARVN